MAFKSLSKIFQAVKGEIALTPDLFNEFVAEWRDPDNLPKSDSAHWDMLAAIIDALPPERLPDAFLKTLILNPNLTAESLTEENKPYSLQDFYHGALKFYEAHGGKLPVRGVIYPAMVLHFVSANNISMEADERKRLHDFVLNTVVDAALRALPIETLDPQTRKSEPSDILTSLADPENQRLDDLMRYFFHNGHKSVTESFLRGIINLTYTEQPKRMLTPLLNTVDLLERNDVTRYYQSFHNQILARLSDVIQELPDAEQIAPLIRLHALKKESYRFDTGQQMLELEKIEKHILAVATRMPLEQGLAARESVYDALNIGNFNFRLPVYKHKIAGLKDLPMTGFENAAKNLLSNIKDNLPHKTTKDTTALFEALYDAVDTLSGEKAVIVLKTALKQRFLKQIDQTLFEKLEQVLLKVGSEESFNLAMRFTQSMGLDKTRQQALFDIAVNKLAALPKDKQGDAVKALLKVEDDLSHKAQQILGAFMEASLPDTIDTPDAFVAANAAHKKALSLVQRPRVV